MILSTILPDTPWLRGPDAFLAPEGAFERPPRCTRARCACPPSAHSRCGQARAGAGVLRKRPSYLSAKSRSRLLRSDLQEQSRSLPALPHRQTAQAARRGDVMKLKVVGLNGKEQPLSEALQQRPSSAYMETLARSLDLMPTRDRPTTTLRPSASLPSIGGSAESWTRSATATGRRPSPRQICRKVRPCIDSPGRERCSPAGLRVAGHVGAQRCAPAARLRCLLARARARARLGPREAGSRPPSLPSPMRRTHAWWLTLRSARR